MIHHIKCEPRYFEDINLGLKTFEYRVNDRSYKVNDTLILHEYIPTTQQYTGRCLTCLVVYIFYCCLIDFKSSDYVIMGIRL